MAKLSFLAGAVAGYVLGARAGKARYEQIKTGATKVWSNPQVQSQVGKATETVKTTVAPAVTDKLGDAVKSAASTMKEKAGDAKDKASDVKQKHDDKDLPETIHRDKDGNLVADTSGFGPGGDKLPGHVGRD